MAAVPDTLVYEINPLPDFLADHTLPGQSESERLKEHSGRWIQFVASLWTWKGRAAFAIRYVSTGGVTRIFLVAIPFAAEDRPVLAGAVEVLLRTHRLIRYNARAEIDLAAFEKVSRLENPAFVDLGQCVIRGLWSPQSYLVNQVLRKEKELEQVSEQEWQQPIAIYPWRGAGGPFLLPMESLLSQPVKSVLTIHLAPTELTRQEWRWLSLMAMAAQSEGEETLTPVNRGAGGRRVDPSAALAGRLYMANFRRLTTAPFLTMVQCAADCGRHNVARSVAGAVQSLLQESPFDKSDPDIPHLPSGASAYLSELKDGNTLAAKLYDGLNIYSILQPGPLGRLPLLVDATGAATVFRLPVSVRGGVPGVPVREFPPDFHPGPRVIAPPSDSPSLRIGTFEGGGAAYIPVADLTRHTLVTGFTGTGKTVTLLQLLHQLWVDHHIPFLVLESAKQEYRGLSGVAAFKSGNPPVRIYTLGNENCVPFRLNPFELLPGVRVESHISRLQVCFEAAAPAIGPSVSVISEALHRVYENCGWRLGDVYPRTGQASRRFPTLRDYITETERVIVDRAYTGETLDNVRAALVGRLKPLLLGSKGMMFDVQRSHPNAQDLFEGPVILEMNDLNLDEKAMAVMFFLALLREYREVHRGDGQKLLHVTVVEEAHNVLAEVKSEGSGEGATKADTRFKAVEAFCTLLTEIRSLGEGLIIADQSPEKLARDAMRNTNFQIAHQLREAKDRQAIADAMIMDKEQRDFLGKLDRGVAAVFRTGFEKATFVKMDPYYSNPDNRGWGFRSNLDDDSVRGYMRELGLLPPDRSAAERCFQGCELCAKSCQRHDQVFALLSQPEERARGNEWFESTTKIGRSKTGKSLDQVWQEVVADALSSLKASTMDSEPDALWCYFVHRWHLAALDAGMNGEQIRLSPEHRENLLKHVASVEAGSR
jgi:hypothetical protein